jgi:hypothetical protein
MIVTYVSQYSPDYQNSDIGAIFYVCVLLSYLHKFTSVQDIILNFFSCSTVSQNKILMKHIHNAQYTLVSSMNGKM